MTQKPQAPLLSGRVLQDLPAECLRLIISHLPTVSSIINLALTSRHFFTQISADEFATLGDFVQSSFPSIKVYPPWKNAAIQLTSRSRAWDRRAFIARECYNPDTDWKHLSSASNYGFVPVIDSYETSAVPDAGPRKEVLAHSAAGRILVRVQNRQSSHWKELKFEDDHLPSNDILDLSLLRPHQQPNQTGETVIFRRANGEVSRVNTQEDPHLQTASFVTPADEVDCMAISDEKDPLMALCTSKSLHIYSVNSEGPSVKATEDFKLEELSGLKSSTRCARFLSSDLLAIGRQRTPIQIYNLEATPSQRTALEPLHSLHSHRKNSPLNLQANVLKALENGNGRSTNLVLSGWSDGVTRLFDTRLPQSLVSIFEDPVDDGQIMSLLPIGYERFLAGSSQNGCLKSFDLRLPGMQPYSRRSLPKETSKPYQREEKLPCPYPCHIEHPDRRGINIFIAPLLGWRSRSWEPIFRHPYRQPNGRFSDRYRGAIYALSSPSSASSTVYATITDHVLQLDSVSTDDVYRDGVVDSLLHIPKDRDPNVLSFSTYERPREGHEATDPVLLRQQLDWSHVVGSYTGKEANGRPFVGKNVPQFGWDERWIAPKIGVGRWNTSLFR